MSSKLSANLISLYITVMSVLGNYVRSLTVYLVILQVFLLINTNSVCNSIAWSGCHGGLEVLIVTGRTRGALGRAQVPPPPPLIFVNFSWFDL